MNKHEVKTIETYDTTAAQWAKSHAIVNEWKWAADRLHKYLPSGSVLEVGCGGGRDAAELIKRGYDYYGIDASAGMVGVARQEVPAGVFEQRSVYDLVSLGKTFDAFWACAVLLHIPRSRIDEAFEAIKSQLKQDAIGVISIKDGDTEHFEVRNHNGFHQERLFVYWQKEQFEAVLQRHGFMVLEYHFLPMSERNKWHTFFVKGSPK